MLLTNRLSVISVLPSIIILPFKEISFVINKFPFIIVLSPTVNLPSNTKFPFNDKSSIILNLELINVLSFTVNVPFNIVLPSVVRSAPRDTSSFT